MAVAGPVADWLGVQVWFVVGGIVGLLMGLCMAIVPAIRHLEDHTPPAEEVCPGEHVAETAAE
jgi:hypothetical protein